MINHVMTWKMRLEITVVQQKERRKPKKFGNRCNNTLTQCY